MIHKRETSPELWTCEDYLQLMRLQRQAQIEADRLAEERSEGRLLRAQKLSPHEH